MANSDVIYSSERTITELGMNSCGTHLIPKNSLVLSTRAPIGHVCITGVELCTNQGCKALVNEKTTDVKFHYYYLSSQTDELNKRGNGATFLELSTTSLANFPLIMPELHEQKEIASYLDKKCAEIDSAIQNKEALIQKVTEYKTRLISDAVTGKIDVRGEDIKP